jgi:hypothetical protein
MRFYSHSPKSCGSARLCAKPGQYMHYPAVPFIHPVTGAKTPLHAHGILANMKLHPTRNRFAGRSELRGRMMTEIFTSERGQRVLRECQETLDRPANADDYSQQLVLERFATELDIYEYELEDLLKRLAGAGPKKENHDRQNART